MAFGEEALIALLKETVVIEPGRVVLLGVISLTKLNFHFIVQSAVYTVHDLRVAAVPVTEYLRPETISHSLVVL